MHHASNSLVLVGRWRRRKRSRMHAYKGCRAGSGYTSPSAMVMHNPFSVLLR